MRTKNSFIGFFYNNWSILFIISIGLLPITFFKDGLLLSAGEGIKDLDINHYFKYYDWYTWRDELNPGEPNAWIPHLFIFDSFFYFFSLIGFSLRTVQIFWFIFLWMSAGLSMYFLIRTISDNREYKLWAFLAAFLYLFNTFTMFKVIDENFRLVHIALPLTLAFFIKGFREEESTTKYAILIGLSSLIFASASVNIPAVSVIWITLFFYFCFDILMNKKLSANKILFCFKILLFYVLLNFWWMIVTIPAMTSSSEQLKEALTFSAPDTRVFEAFRFLGSWAFKSGHQGVNYFPYYLSYYGENKTVTFSSFLIFILAFSSLLFKKRNKIIIFFAGLALVGIFLVKGIGEPLGQIYWFIWKNVPGFWVFREPFTKFTPIVIFASALLFGYTISEFSKRTLLWFQDKKRTGFIFKFLFLFSIISIVSIAAFPIFTGQIFREESIGAMKSQYIMFPKYWLDAGEWFENYDKDNKVFVLPKSGYGAPYDWEHGIATAGPVTTILIPNPFLTYRVESSDGEKLINDLYNYFEPQSETQLVKFLRFFGIKYILQQNDLSWNNALPDTYSPVVMKSILEKQEGIELFQHFGELDIYKLQDRYFLPTIYVPQKIVCSEGNSHSFFNVVSSLNNSLIPTAIFFSETGCNKDVLSTGGNSNNIIEMRSPKLTFKRISPVKYKINIQRADYPFLLVFSENFNTKWKVYIFQKQLTIPTIDNDLLRDKFYDTLFKNSLLDGKHYLVNGYANAWWIDIDELEKQNEIKKSADGTYNFEIVIEYWPQRLFYFGLFISGLTLIFCTSYLIWDRKEKIKSDITEFLETK